MTCTLTRLCDEVFVATKDLTGFGGSVNASLFLFDDCAVVVDTLCSPRDMSGFFQLVSEARSQVTVVYTHADWDHCLGTSAFPSRTVIAHDAAVNRFLDEGQRELARIQVSNPVLVEGASIILPDLTFEARFAGNMLEIFHLPGHTEDSSVVWIPNKGILAAGDAVEDGIPSVGNPKRLGEWAKALRDWGERALWVIPGHGEPQGPEICYRNARYLESLVNSIRLNTPFGIQTPDTSLNKLSPDTAAHLEKMSVSEQDFYREVHEDNVRRVLDFVASDV